MGDQRAVRTAMRRAAGIPRPSRGVRRLLPSLRGARWLAVVLLVATAMSLAGAAERDCVSRAAPCPLCGAHACATLAVPQYSMALAEAPLDRPRDEPRHGRGPGSTDHPPPAVVSSV